MPPQDVLQSALACVHAALPLTSPAGPPPPQPTTKDPYSDDEYHHKLEESLSSLDAQLKRSSSSSSSKVSKQRDDDGSTAAELAVACKATCNRLLALTAARAAKRINTSPGSWKSARPSVKNSRQGLEVKRLEERLDELRSSLTGEIGKSLSYRLSGIKKQLRQLQLESQRLRCEKYDRIKSITSRVKDVDSRIRATQGGKEKPLTPDELAALEAKFAEIHSLHESIKGDLVVLRGVAFRSSVARHDSIPAAHQETFSWVFEGDGAAPSGLLSWLESGDGIFWVSGKPGAGKSTLVKFIADHEKTQGALAKWSASKPVVVVSHYFWCAGTAMQRSHYGLLRTLVYEILRQFPDYIGSWLPSSQAATAPSKASWTIEELNQLLLNIVEQPDLPVRLCFFIDGLDEFDGDHFALCQQLMQLSKTGNAKLCLSSRPWSVFTEVFGSGVIPQLCLHDVTKRDIRSYVENRLLQHLQDMGVNGDIIKDLTEAITDKSQGVFLWVSLVANRMMEMSTLDSKADLLGELEKCPSDLDEFFTYILGEVDAKNTPKMASSLLITAEAEKPLDIGVYYFHDMEYDDPEYVFSLSSEPPGKLEHRKQLTDTTKRVEERCQRLLAVDKNTNVVNVLHRTARDYLDLAETKAMLVQKAPANFQPNLSLVKALTAWLKTNRATKAEEPKSEFIAGTKTLLFAAAQILELGDANTVIRLIDDFDKSLDEKGPSAEENLQLLRHEVVGHKLFKYLSGVLERIPNYFRLFTIPPLVVALDPEYPSTDTRESRLRWDASTAHTIKCLLDQGQRPGASFSAAETLAESSEKSPWLVLCEFILPHHEDAPRITGKVQQLLKVATETDMLKNFLAAGVDVEATCVRPGRSASIVAVDYLFLCLAVDASEDSALKKLYLDHLRWFMDAKSGETRTKAEELVARIELSLREKGTADKEFLEEVASFLTRMVSGGSDDDEMVGA